MGREVTPLQARILSGAIAGAIVGWFIVYLTFSLPWSWSQAVLPIIACAVVGAIWKAPAAG